MDERRREIAAEAVAPVELAGGGIPAGSDAIVGDEVDRVTDDHR